MKTNKSKCLSCGNRWVEHKGIQPTCAALQVAMDALHQISTIGKHSTRASRVAKATIAFLETQIEPPPIPRRQNASSYEYRLKKGMFFKVLNARQRGAALMCAKRIGVKVKTAKLRGLQYGKYGIWIKP